MTCSLTSLILVVLLSLPPQTRPCGSDDRDECPAYASALADATAASAREHGLRQTLLLAVAWRESRWDPRAVSRTGDWGVWQLNPRWPQYGTAHGTCNAIPEACLHVQAQAAGALLAHRRRRCRTLYRALTAYHWGGCDLEPGYARRVLWAERWLLGYAKGSRVEL